MIHKFDKIKKVSGNLSLAGDKSISHRALIISALAKGKSYLKNLSISEDVRATLNCLQQIGIEIIFNKNQTIVNGNGFKGFKKPSLNLNTGNSGTTARLLSGVLAAQNFESTVTGDFSLSKRPMNRIIEPLKLMGAQISSLHKDKLPLQINPTEKLKAITYQLPIASAQVKSAVLLAGLYIEETTQVIELTPTRNHTENLLNLNVRISENKIISCVSSKNYPEAKEYFIPGDISSAIYFIVLTLLTKNSELIIENVSLNKTRTAALDLLMKMGAKINIEFSDELNREEYGNIYVESSELKNIKIENEIIPLIIDEIPILAVASLLADGEFKISNASELRVKESDRIKSLCQNFIELGLNVAEYDDGFSVSGEAKNRKPNFKCFDDHRIAMAFSILSCLLKKGGSVEGIESIAISNPDFLRHLKENSS
ncbi:MAG: 3-phosphoshikimate 1-carboxyvinyltransferase [Ignavibacteria bacterium]|nr:3-phosphoshikimate 1-carboxyvinyltransferase [Ignavibacteria bacterium]NNL21672.1 3-phosphoshikimate 1-carboxyvinyltransferase [Ignavibacteriaceae bacterium]